MSTEADMINRMNGPASQHSIGAIKNGFIVMVANHLKEGREWVDLNRIKYFYPCTLEWEEYTTEEKLRQWLPSFGKQVETPDGPGILRNFYYDQMHKEITGLLVEMTFEQTSAVQHPCGGEKVIRRSPGVPQLIVYNFNQVKCCQ